MKEVMFLKTLANLTFSDTHPTRECDKALPIYVVAISMVAFAYVVAMPMPMWLLFQSGCYSYVSCLCGCYAYGNVVAIPKWLLCLCELPMWLLCLYQSGCHGYVSCLYVVANFDMVAMPIPMAM
eukprot:6461246-Amphidinium_carterae.3